MSVGYSVPNEQFHTLVKELLFKNPFTDYPEDYHPNQKIKEDKVVTDDKEEFKE